MTWKDGEKRRANDNGLGGDPRDAQVLERIAAVVGVKGVVVVVMMVGVIAVMIGVVVVVIGVIVIGVAYLIMLVRTVVIMVVVVIVVIPVVVVERMNVLAEVEIDRPARRVDVVGAMLQVV